MISRSMTALLGASLLWAIVACKPSGRSGNAEGDDSAFSGEQARPRSPTSRRVTVVALPADANVEVNGVLVPRRDGVVELVGEVGEAPLLRISKGTQSIERHVTIPAKGSPRPLDMNNPDAGAEEPPTEAAVPDAGSEDAGDAGPVSSAVPDAGSGGPVKLGRAKPTATSVESWDRPFQRPNK
jgi:hypothetical protein